MNAETQEYQQDNAAITITLPDGATQSCVAGTTPLDVAKGISQGLAKKVVAAELDGAVYDIDWPIEQSCTLKLIKRDDDDALSLIRHDCAHVMAEAVQTLFPGTQVTIGPVIENGFYYDFAREDGFSSDDLQAIEAKMAEIVERDAPFIREVWDRAEAIEYFRDIGEDYKAEIIQDLPENEPVRIYRQGEWLDLCRGPHMPGTAHVGTAFKLTKLAGAYWRGDSSRAMLTRIYGTAWRTKDELDAYLKQLEEAEARDHRKLGREMDLFHFQPEAQGSAFWHPRGFRIWRELESYIRRRLDDAGYNEIKTPQLIDNALWQKSGHWGKFRENMFVVPDEVPSTDDDDDNVLSGEGRLMALKPMNCPAHVQIFKQGITSYRDLPIRMAEFGCCHRNEAHGALHGLMRVRQMTQDDAHIFCRTDQIKSEVGAFVELCQSVYSDFGFDNVSVKLATRPDNRAGSDEVWDHAEQAMARALQDLNIDYETLPGEGAFYGPKYEFHLKDAIGRSWQMGTCQLDFVMPERLEAEYVGADGDKHTAVMIHRAIFGTLERFIGMLIESSAGKLPLWLAPVQCVVATITDAAADYAEQVHSELKQAGLRSECDTRNEKINYKIREHSNMKTPVIFVVGEREAAENTVAIRRLGSQAQEVNDRAGATSDLAKACQPPY